MRSLLETMNMLRVCCLGIRHVPSGAWWPVDVRLAPQYMHVMESVCAMLFYRGLGLAATLRVFFSKRPRCLHHFFTVD
jgi:hypothetical protein